MIMNGEKVTIWEEAIITYSRYYPGLSRAVGKLQPTSVRRASNLVIFRQGAS
jgi:hypothetical protein